MPREQLPFSKWDPNGTEAQARVYARSVASGADDDSARREAKRSVDDGTTDHALAGKAWLLRWVWVISTAFLLFGYIIMAIMLTGHGEWLGV